MNGWKVDGNGLYYGGEQKHDFNKRQVKVCKEWIKFFAERVAKFNENITSYTLKHIVEETYQKLGFGAYVSNGEFIMAMGELGYNIKPTDEGSINANFNIGFKNLLDLNLKDDIRKFVRSKVWTNPIIDVGEREKNYSADIFEALDWLKNSLDLIEYHSNEFKEGIGWDSGINPLGRPTIEEIMGCLIKSEQVLRGCLEDQLINEYREEFGESTYEKVINNFENIVEKYNLFKYVRKKE